RGRAADGRARPRADVEPEAAAVRRDQPRPRAHRHPRHLCAAALDHRRGHLARHRRAGHRAGARRGEPRLLPAARPRRRRGRGARGDPRGGRGGLLRSLTMEWVNTIVQGVLTGGLYAMFAAGLSLIFGVMRLVNIAHGDFIVLAAYLALVVTETMGLDPLVSLIIVVPMMAAIGYVLQRGLLNLTLGDDLLPPLLVTFGLSVIIQNALLL